MIIIVVTLGNSIQKEGTGNWNGFFLGEGSPNVEPSRLIGMEVCELMY